ncbi:MAG: IclR family transcriptional regulator [Rhodobacteraceae bacterium]|nr:IclR family transcriptional regulator [Paracoccaceae bacterium]MCY4195423.1 IclR family transcriptional regulator [Paracoccaceae bacterium]
MTAKALLKSLRCLDALQRSDTAMDVKEIAAATGDAIGSVQRAIYTLTALGYLERDLDSVRIVPGPACLRPAYGFLRNNALLEVATPYLVDLSDRFDVRSDLTVLDGTDVIYLARIPGRDELLNLSFLGRRWPAIHTASGRAILSAMPDHMREELLAATAPSPITPKSMRDMDKIRAEITTAQTLGYAKMLEEVLIGAASVAAPVFGQGKTVLGSVMIGGEVARFNSRADRRIFGEAAKRTAQAITAYGI